MTRLMVGMSASRSPLIAMLARGAALRATFTHMASSLFVESFGMPGVLRFISFRLASSAERYSFIWFIGIGSLLAGIVGIGNIMLIVVKDRTKELGIRKAMGATPANVIAQVMLEALFVTVLFGYFGLAFAVLLLEGLAAAVPGNPYFENPTIDFRTAIYSLAAMIAAGAMAGYFPARRAAAIQPIEALRDE